MNQVLNYTPINVKSFIANRTCVSLFLNGMFFLFLLLTASLRFSCCIVVFWFFSYGCVTTLQHFVSSFLTRFAFLHVPSRLFVSSVNYFVYTNTNHKLSSSFKISFSASFFAEERSIIIGVNTIFNPCVIHL